MNYKLSEKTNEFFLITRENTSKRARLESLSTTNEFFENINEVVTSTQREDDTAVNNGKKICPLFLSIFLSGMKLIFFLFDSYFECRCNKNSSI